MRAARMHEYKKPLTLEDVPVPDIAADEVLVKVTAAGMSETAAAYRAGYLHGRRYGLALFDGEGTAQDGKPYQNTYAWFMQMRDGKIIRVTAFFDTIEFTDFWQRIAPR